MNNFEESVFWLIIAICFWVVYFKVFRYDRSKLALRRLHNAVKLAYEKHDSSLPYDEIIEKLLIDYNVIVRNIGKIEYSSCLEMLEQIFCRYDTYSNRDFEDFFKEVRNTEIRDFLFTLCKIMREKGPAVELPAYHTKLINAIQEALTEDNSALSSVLTEYFLTNMFSKTHNISSPKSESKTAERITLTGTIISTIKCIYEMIVGILPFI